MADTTFRGAVEVLAARQVRIEHKALHDRCVTMEQQIADYQTQNIELRKDIAALRQKVEGHEKTTAKHALEYASWREAWRVWEDTQLNVACQHKDEFYASGAMGGV